MANAARQLSRTPVPKIVFAYAGEIDNVVDDDPRAIKKETLLEKLDCPVGDNVLRAMRSVLTMTYTTELDPDGLRKTFGHIRELIVGALRPIPHLLKLVKSKPVGPDKSWPADDESILHKFVLIKTKDLRAKVNVEGEPGRKPLLELIRTQPADEVLLAARRVLSLTFEEVFSPLEYRQLLGQIRRLCADALQPCNWMLEAIQIEPVAIPTLLGHEFLEEDLAEREDSLQA